MFFFQTNRNADLQYRKIMSDIAALDSKIQELIAAQAAESARVTKVQADLKSAVDALTAKLAQGAAPIDTTAEIASIQSAIDSLNSTDADPTPLPAPVAE